MKIICDGADLSDAVLKVSKGTSNKTTNPILEGIKVVAEEDYVTLSATDLELSIEKTIKGMVQLEGEMVVPGKFFCEYIKKWILGSVVHRIFSAMHFGPCNIHIDPLRYN